MIVQHTDKECKTKFSIGVEFNFSLKANSKFIKNFLHSLTISATLLTDKLNKLPGDTSKVR